MWSDFYSEMVDGEDLQSHPDAHQRIAALFSAPEAIAPFSARKPASRPITSTKNKRSCEVAVSRI